MFCKFSDGMGFADCFAFFHCGLKSSSFSDPDLLEQLEPSLPMSSSLLPNEGNPLGCGSFHPLFDMGSSEGVPSLGDFSGDHLVIGRPPAETKGFLGGDVF